MTLHSPVNANDYQKAFKMNGYFFDDEPYDTVKASTPDSVPKVLKKDGTPAKNAHLLSTHQFNLIMDEITKCVSDLYQSLSSGHIDLTPAISDKNDTDIYPCTFCPYASICLFDVFVNDNREISSSYGQDILKKEDK